MWFVTYRETVYRPSATVQVVHIEDESGNVLILERPAGDEELNGIEIAALALQHEGLAIDPNDI